MKFRSIGSLSVSEVGIGCNNFGGRIDEAATHEVVNAALEVGINFFDTADIYGKTLSEEFLGRAIKGRRDQVIIATKFGYQLDKEGPDASPDYIRKACDDSLRRLGIDCIDLYQQHLPDPKVPIEDTLGTLNELVLSGKVKEIGCSNFDVPMLKDAEAKAKGAKFVSVQNHYSLFHREPEEGVLEECARQGLGFLPYFPLAYGLLSGKYRKGQPLPQSFRITEGHAQLTEQNLDRVELLTAFCESRGHTILELAFAWLLSKQLVSSVIAGATSAAQVKANSAAPGWVLTQGELDEIDQIVQ